MKVHYPKLYNMDHLSLNVLLLTTGPSSAFEKWSGHEIPKTFYECRRHELGESTRGGIPPLVRGVRGISPEKILYFRTSVQTILMHFGTIFTLEALLIL